MTRRIKKMKKNKTFILLVVLAFTAGFFTNYKTLRIGRYKRLYCEAFMKKERLAIIQKGDIASYKLYIDSVAKEKRIPLSNSFYYSFFMALNCNYGPANYDAYETIMKVYPCKDSMDVDTRKLCIFFLKRGLDRKDERCADILKKMKIECRALYCNTDLEDQVWEK